MMALNDPVSIQLQKNDSDFFNYLDSNKLFSYTKLETSSFDGQSEVVTILVTLTPIVLTFLGKLISEQIKAKKYVKIIYKGVQIKGVDEKNAAKILKELLDHKDQG